MSAPIHAVVASRIFDGASVRADMAVLIDDARIAAVLPRAELPTNVPVEELPRGSWLAPGLIDIQVNGGGDLLFNNRPTPETISGIVAAHRRLGTTALLPTLISDTADKMAAALAAIEAAIESEPGVLGIHLEGPFLSPEKAGIHDKRRLRQPTAQDLAMISVRRKGVTLVTLAPERVPMPFIQKLAAADVRVALGHSMATYAQTQAAIAGGLTGFTHLFNAMRPIDAREPGPIAAALESPDVWYGLIVDGIHVAPAMLRLALRGTGKVILVSDAMPPVGGSCSSYEISGEPIFVQDGRCTAADGTLAGAYLDLATAVRNCVRLLNVPLADALRFASTHPAAFLGLGDRLGRLASGFRADMVALDGDTLEVLGTWVAGASSKPVPPGPPQPWP